MKIRYINRQAIVYLITGGLNTIISLVLYYIMLKIGVNYLVDNTLCFIIGVVLGYCLNAIFVFKHQLNFRALSKYIFVYLSSLVISLLVLFIFVEWFNINKMAAQVLTTAIITIINYLMIKRFVFFIK